MKESLRLPILIFLSLLFHLGIISLIPEIKFDKIEKEKVYEVKLIKPKTVKVKSTTKKLVNDNNQTNKSSSAKPKKAVKKKIDYAGFKKPDIVMPKINNEEKILVPDSIIESNTKAVHNENIKPTANVNNELSKASKSFNESKSTLNKKGIKNSVYGDSDFFEIKSLSDNERFLLNRPNPPKYSLENDSKIVLKFYIDKYGKPTKITYLTRSDSKVEKLAMDYVSKLRFGAVDYDTLDAVQITLFFKVR